MKHYLFLFLLIISACSKSDVKPSTQTIDGQKLSFNAEQIKTAKPDEVKETLQGSWICDSTRTQYLTNDKEDSITVSHNASSDVGARYIITKDTLQLFVPPNDNKLIDGVYSISSNPSDTLFLPDHNGLSGRLIVNSISNESLILHTVPGKLTSNSYYTSEWLYYSKTN